MRKLVAFTNLTLDGYFADPEGDIGWAHAGGPDPEFDGFVAGNASSGGELVLGRKTYELMASYWPTPSARQSAPVVAERMNQMRKVVFSRTMDTTSWSNTTVIKGDLAGAIRRLKKESGPGMAILGSGSIVSQLAQEGLIDEYQMVVNPVALGKGKPLFEGITAPLALKLTGSRVFRQGKVFLSYEPAVASATRA